MLYIIAFLSFFSLNLSAAIMAPPQIVASNILTAANQTVQLQSPQLSGAVVIFMSAKCPCSNSHVEVVKKLSEQYKNFQFVAVHSNTDESKEDSETYFKKAQFSFPVLQDSDAKIADQFKAFKTPHAFVINPKGEIVYQGGVTDSSHAPSAAKNYLADALAEVSQNKPVSVAQSRTLGCVILRK